MFCLVETHFSIFIKKVLDDFFFYQLGACGAGRPLSSFGATFFSIIIVVVVFSASFRLP